MEIAKLFESILNNSDRITSFAILIFLVIALAWIVYALETGKLATPSDHKRIVGERNELADKLDESGKVLDTARAELTDSRVLYAAAVVRIEFLEKDGRAKDQTISDLLARVARLEAELDVRRQIGSS